MAKYKGDDFLSKFANRVEKVGRDGVMGLMKSTGLPINNILQNNYNDQNHFNSFQRKNDLNESHKNIAEHRGSMFAPRIKNNIYVNRSINKFPENNTMIKSMKHYSFLDNNSSLNSSIKETPSFNRQNIINYHDNEFRNNYPNNRNSLIQSVNLHHNTNNIYTRNPNNAEDNNNFITRSQVRKHSMQYHYNNPNALDQNANYTLKRNTYTVANNRQNIIDHGYIPYTLKDYKKISNDVKLGKLGPNIGTEEWEKKKNRMKKMSEYGNKVIYEGKGCKNKVSESADERHRRLQEFKTLTGKWNIINEYSKGLLLNKDKNSNEIFKKNANDKLIEEERLIDQKFELDLRENEEEERMLQQQNNVLYQQRLNRMKNLLF